MKRVLPFIVVVYVSIFLSGCYSMEDSKYLPFQNVKYRKSNSPQAFIGSIGLKRREGPNTFDIKYVPKWEGLAVAKTGAFLKTESRQFSFFTKVSNMGLVVPTFSKEQVSAGGTFASFESGYFTIYSIINTKELVDELNRGENEGIRKYLRQSKDYRIITSMVLVEGHSSVKANKIGIHWGIKLVSIKMLGNPLSMILGFRAPRDIVNANGQKVTLTYAEEELVSMADNSIYAYEYGRIIWDKTRYSKIIDILVDRPSSFFHWSDADSTFPNAEDNPRKLPDSRNPQKCR